MDISALCAELGVEAGLLENGDLAVHTPIDGSLMAHVSSDDAAAISQKISNAESAFQSWRLTPPPKRGELVRLLGEELRTHKQALARLVTIECGKILPEGLGEVQEMIDICDFAVGLSRQLYGLTIASERPGHRMMETWHPLGPAGIITAFNFPVAVWAWNAALAIVCGNPVVWKPSEKTPVTALACQALFARAAARFDGAPDALGGLSQIIIGASDAGAQLVDDPRIALISATGSCAMGQIVGPKVAARFGRSLLELGGNNAMIVTPKADLDLAQRAVVFSAVGTAGQRCTSLRRLFLHEDIYVDMVDRLRGAYDSLPIGDPLAANTLVGPLIDGDAFAGMENALAQARDQGGTVHGGERVLPDSAHYVRPAIVEMPGQSELVKAETFAPILYVLKYSDLSEAIDAHNDVNQGLASAIFTNDVREAELFLSSAGSDCGIANVNIGPSGAEIGGAFGGEKHTGGGRESGSDAWKSYMRRATNTINYSSDLPLAQGIKFA